jgi:hypothetical protein
VSEIIKTGAVLPHWMEEGTVLLHLLKLQFIVMLLYDFSEFAGGCYLQMLVISPAGVSH